MKEWLKDSNWIWSPDWDAEDKQCPRIVLFRKKFDMEEEPLNGSIRISADTRYKLYVNGSLAEFGPSRGDQQVWFYDTVDLLPYLKKGTNVIGVSVLRYPEEPAMGNHGMIRTPIPGLYVTGELRDGSGMVYDVSADATWKCWIDRAATLYREEERFAPLYIHEKTAGSPERFGWKMTWYDDSRWSPALPYRKVEVPEAVSPGNLKARTIPYLYRKKRYFRDVMKTAQDNCGNSQDNRGNYGSDLDMQPKLEEPSRKARSASVSITQMGETTAIIHNDSAYKKLARNEIKNTVLDQEESTVKQVEFSAEDWKYFLLGERDIMIPAHTGTVVELDAGEEMTGFIRAAFRSGEGARVSLLYSEAYVQDEVAGPERIPIKGDRIDSVNGHLQGYEDVYRVAGLGNEEEYEVFEPYWFRTFRFVRLRIEAGEKDLVFHRLDYEETGYPLEVSASVQTSDPSLDAIWEISERTLRRCMHETYEDCPFYEQLQYIMDARAQILYTYSVSADDRLARKCMDDLRRSQRYDGLLNCCYPNGNPNVIPGFSIYYILMVYDHMMYFGDRELVAEHMPVIEQILHYFERHLTEQGYVEKVGGVNMEARFWSFIDWATEWNDTSGMPPAGLHGPLTMETLLYIYGLQHAGELADFLGRGEEAKQYRKRAGKAQEAVRKNCVGADGMLQDGPGVDEYSQHCQVFAVLTDTMEPEQGKANLLKTITEPGYVQCTVAMRFYLFRALEKTGLYAYTDQYWNTWRNMIQLHCTTCVEAEAYARSECHAWGSLILHELPSVTLGVRPAAPGYQKIRIAPVPGYLTWAKGTVPTKWGMISVEWKKTADGKLDVAYEIPETARGKVEFLDLK
ncbi:MAG: hypothetical protein LUG99_02870 [Lachnospiraceae bacterium]|nr:hypothetical protein [Lachnospiraceae bacterium]